MTLMARLQWHLDSVLLMSSFQIVDELYESMALANSITCTHHTSCSILMTMILWVLHNLSATCVQGLKGAILARHAIHVLPSRHASADSAARARAATEREGKHVFLPNTPRPQIAGSTVARTPGNEGYFSDPWGNI